MQIDETENLIPTKNKGLYGVIESLYYIIHEIVSTWIVRIDYGFTTGK